MSVILVLLGILAAWAFSSHVMQVLGGDTEHDHYKAALTLIATAIALGFLGVLLK